MIFDYRTPLLDEFETLNPVPDFICLEAEEDKEEESQDAA